MPRPLIKKCEVLGTKRGARWFVYRRQRCDGPQVHFPNWLRLSVGVWIWLGFAVSTHVADDASLTLAAAWQQVREANPLLAAAEVETDRRRAEQRATRSLRGPQIELAGRYTMIDQPMVIDLDPIRRAMLALHPDVPSAAIPPFIQPVQDEHFTRAQLTAVWPIYAGGRIDAAQRAATAGVGEAEAEARNTSGHLFSELVRRFYGAQLARVVRSLRVDTLASLTEHSRQAELLEREGQIARAERLHAQVARDEAERELID